MTKQATLLVQALASSPSDVARMVAGIDEDAARRRRGGQRAVTDVLAALVAVEGVRQVQFARIAREDRPHLTDEPAREQAADNPGSCEELVTRFTAAREQTLALLADLPVGGWGRRAVHDRLGETRMWLLVRDLVDHDLTCLAELAEARQRFRTPASAGARPDEKADQHG